VKVKFGCPGVKTGLAVKTDRRVQAGAFGSLWVLRIPVEWVLETSCRLPSGDFHHRRKSTKKGRVPHSG
jgi:hypothetical protein